MRFESPKRLFKFRMVLYSFLLLYVIYTFARNYGSPAKIHSLIYILLIIFISAIIYFYYTVYGYHIAVKDDGVYKEWGILGRILKAQKIVSFVRIFMVLKPDEVVFHDLGLTGRVSTAASFQEATGGAYPRGHSSIPVSEYREFLREVFSRIKYCELRPDSKEVADSLGLSLGSNFTVK